MINAVEKLNLNSVSIDNLKILVKCFENKEGEENKIFDGLIEESQKGEY